MENKEGTRTCGQCHKEVAEANFDLHETHCRRFLTVCPDCNESVPREQLKQHREEQHTMVRCSKCNKKMERCELLDHEADECEERLQSCTFCELEMPFKELEEHCLACGSRTELCRECNRYVTLKDQATHNLTCSGSDNASGPLQTISKTPANKAVRTVICRVCKASFPEGKIEEHELECVLADSQNNEEAESEEEEDNFSQGASPRLTDTYKATSFSNRAVNGPWGGGGDPNQISTCPHCHLALPLITLRWHEVKCSINVHLKEGSNTMDQLHKGKED